MGLAHSFEAPYYQETDAGRTAMNQWVGIAVESSVPWPTVDTNVRYRGHEIVLRAATETTLPSVEIDFAPPMGAGRCASSSQALPELARVD